MYFIVACYISKFYRTIKQLNMEPPNDPIQSDQSTADRLQKIIDVLTKYKTSIVNKETLNHQDPANTIKNLTGILRGRGGDLKEYLNTRNSNIDSDSIFEETVAALDPLINPWTPEISILIKDYVDKLFIDSPPFEFKVKEYLEKNARTY